MQPQKFEAHSNAYTFVNNILINMIKTSILKQLQKECCFVFTSNGNPLIQHQAAITKEALHLVLQLC